MSQVDRDFIGYGQHSPKDCWPDGARIAINFVINYEEGAESHIFDGDEYSEYYLTDIPGLPALKNARHLSSESCFEYGSRSGIWRLIRLFDKQEIPVTFFIVGLALRRNPELADYLKNSEHDIAGHGYRWINYRDVGRAVEQEHIKKTCNIVTEMTGKTVTGWYTGRRSPDTRDLIVAQGIRYDSESYADDLPYWISVADIDNNTGATKPHLIIPYSFDTNDAKYAASPGWSTGADFYNHLCASFDYLYNEGERSPKMMTVAVHPRLSGRPGRTMAIAQFIKHTQQHQYVWYCRRDDIAEHWYQTKRPKGF